jgi:hypothetical protein
MPPMQVSPEMGRHVKKIARKFNVLSFIGYDSKKKLYSGF